MPHKNVARVVAVVLAVAVLGGCGFLTLLAPTLFGNLLGTPLEFDMEGAVAIAASDETERALGASRAFLSESGLVKLMADGTVQDLSSWADETISFITSGDDGSVYIGYTYSDQLVRVFPDSSFQVLWPPEGEMEGGWGSVEGWTWWGMDSDPIVAGANGAYYFAVTTPYSDVAGDAIYRYDSDARSAPVRITPADSELKVACFLVDSRDRLFILENPEGSNEASYLRMYVPGVTGPINVFYESTSADVWVRGITVSPTDDYLLVNGSNVRGMSGILRVDIAADNTLGYSLVYPNTGYNWINLVQEYGSWCDTAIIEGTEVEGVYRWTRSETAGGGDLIDLDRVLAIVRRYLWIADSANPTLTPLGAILFDESRTSSDLELTIGALTGEALVEVPDAEGNPVDITYTTLAQLITTYPETLLRGSFNEMLFWDWLQLPENFELASVDFMSVGFMTWQEDGLYGLYNASWWGDAGGTKLIKLLNRDGERDLELVELVHDRTSSAQIVDGWLYYRYDILDGDLFPTGFHGVARRPVSTTGVEEDLLTDPSLPDLEILSYDVASDNSEIYIVGFDQLNNVVIGGRVSLPEKIWTFLDVDVPLTKIRVIE